MAKLEALVLLLILCQLHRHIAAATAGGAKGVVAARAHRTLVTQQPQRTAGGELAVLGHSPGPSPTLYAAISRKDGVFSPQVSTPPLDPGVCNYKVRTQTGDQWTAGTDSTISLRLENRQQDNIYIVLSAGGIERGDQNTFTFQDRCVPQICKMILYTDSKGWLPCWYAVFIDVSVNPVSAGTPTNEASDYQRWQVEQWLPAHEWSSATSLARDHCAKLSA